jgi:hypothetical protein
VKDLWPDDWLDIVEQDCGLGRSRAYEVMAIADGRTSLKEIRSGNAQRQKTLRERRKPESVTDGMSRTEPEPKPGSVEYERDKAECIALFQKAAAAEQELAEHKAAMKAACAAAEAKAEPATDLEVRWRQSLRNRVALQMGMPAHWDREFPDWRTYSIDADLVKLVAGAFAAWGELAAELARRETAGRAAKEAAE